jgi:hypothetical protein
MISLVRVLPPDGRHMQAFDPGVPPALGSVLLFDSADIAVRKDSVIEVLSSAPWCTPVMLMAQRLCRRDVTAILCGLPTYTLTLSEPADSEVDAIRRALRSRPPPTDEEVIEYLHLRRLPQNLTLCVAGVWNLRANTGSPVKWARTRRRFNRHLASHGPFSVHKWHQLRLILSCPTPAPEASFERLARACQVEPRALRRWISSLMALPHATVLKCPGWEWKLEAALRHGGYVVPPGGRRSP